MRKKYIFFPNLKIAETKMSPKIVFLIRMSVLTLVLDNDTKSNIHFPSIIRKTSLK